MSPLRSPHESAAALDAAVDAAQRMLIRLDEDTSLAPLRPGGWCARETLGHLLDSACNNLRRFVIGQPPGVEHFDGYRQEEWVSRQAHRSRPWHDLVTLWTEYNRHLAHVMRHTSDAAAEGSATAPDGSGSITVRFLMDDYVVHLQHHLDQIEAFAGRLPPQRRTGSPVTAPEARMPEPGALRGVRHDLVPVNPDAHAPGLFAGSHTPQAAGMWTYMSYGPFEDVERMRTWLVSCAASTDPLYYTLIQRDTGRPVGMCSLLHIDPAMRTIELGQIWYAPDVQGSGVNADMALTLLTACIERWGYRRAEWKCDALNTRSRAAALKLGFTFEGIFRQHLVIKGHNRDTAWFSLLDSEWPAVKRALERSLRG
jgi:RimJ/RimL family protein N-acetyltransferase